MITANALPFTDDKRNRGSFFKLSISTGPSKQTGLAQIGPIYPPPFFITLIGNKANSPIETLKKAFGSPITYFDCLRVGDIQKQVKLR